MLRRSSSFRCRPQPTCPSTIGRANGNADGSFLNTAKYCTTAPASGFPRGKVRADLASAAIPLSPSEGERGPLCARFGPQWRQYQDALASDEEVIAPI